MSGGATLTPAWRRESPTAPWSLGLWPWGIREGKRGSRTPPRKARGLRSSGFVKEAGGDPAKGLPPAPLCSARGARVGFSHLRPPTSAEAAARAVPSTRTWSGPAPPRLARAGFGRGRRRRSRSAVHGLARAGGRPISRHSAAGRASCGGASRRPPPLSSAASSDPPLHCAPPRSSATAEGLHLQRLP